ncbi:MAG: DnaB-like helicase N-terminal domain-containing protein, partial [Candidatus Saccharimonadales bacterium]
MAENSKIPPQSVEAESSLIGSILIDQEAMTKIADIVSSNDFYETRHNQIFSSILQLYEQRRPIDVLTVTEKLESSGIIDKVGGASYITDLANSVPSAAHVEEYADIVAKKATLRRLIGAAQEITNLGYSDSQDTAELIDQAEQLLYGVSDNKNRQAFRSIGDVLSESFDRIEELSKDKGKLRGVSTGFRSVDNILAG